MRSARFPDFPSCKPAYAGQLTSVFTRGLRSEHTQVLLDGVPINQGLQGAFNFADLTTDDIDGSNRARAAKHYCMGRARWRASSKFSRSREGNARFKSSAEGGSYDTFREGIAKLR